MLNFSCFVSALRGACFEMGESEPGISYVLANFCYLTFLQAEARSKLFYSRLVSALMGACA